MASHTRAASAAGNVRTGTDALPAHVRECTRYRGELARHRVLTADGQDYVVATLDERNRDRGFTTAAYPVSRGYLVMMRQPLCVLPSRDEDAARAQHDLLARVLAEAGTGVVRARRRSAAWRKAERAAQGDVVDRLAEIDPFDLAPSARPARSPQVLA
jgi:hypothetical protein